MKKTIYFLITASLFAGFSFAQAVNTKCPISGQDVDADQTLVIEKAVSFCCGKCLSKFEKDPAAMNEKVIKAESQIVNDACPISGKGTDKTVMVKGQQVGVCCGKCAKKVSGDADFAVTATKPATAKCVVSGEDAVADKTAVANITVAFCCGKCVEKAKKNPSAILEKL